jgi:hypothetical protein
MVVEKRGDEWCVMHCTGPDKGKPIKCFPTEDEANTMHRAIMSNKNREDGRTSFSKTGEFEYTLEFKKIADKDDLIIAGYASSESIDSHGQIMDMDSMKKAWSTYMKNPVIRFMHGLDKVPGAIGRVIDEYTDLSGTTHRTNFDGERPFVVAKISNSPDIHDIRVKIREGLYTGLSVHGIAKKIVEYSKTLGRMVERLFVKSLQEISVVDIAANQDSFFTVLKMACEGDSCGIDTGNDDRRDPIRETDIIIKGDGNMGEFTKEAMSAMIKDTIRDMTQEDQLISKAAAHDALATENIQLKASLQTATNDLAALTSEFETFKKSAGKEGAGAADAEAMKTELADLKGKLETLSSAPFFKAQLGQDGQVPPGNQGTPAPADVRGAHVGAIIKDAFRT